MTKSLRYLRPTATASPNMLVNAIRKSTDAEVKNPHFQMG